MGDNRTDNSCTLMAEWKIKTQKHFIRLHDFRHTVRISFIRQCFCRHGYISLERPTAKSVQNIWNADEKHKNKKDSKNKLNEKWQKKLEPFFKLSTNFANLPSYGLSGRPSSSINRNVFAFKLAGERVDWLMYLSKQKLLHTTLHANISNNVHSNRSAIHCLVHCSQWQYFVISKTKLWKKKDPIKCQLALFTSTMFMSPMVAKICFKWNGKHLINCQ